MNEPHDELIDRLAAMDPALSDPAPAVGSDRFNSIKDHAMTVTRTPARNRFPNRLRIVAVAAAVVAAVAIAATVLTPGPATSAAAAEVQAAADNSSKVTDFRVIMESETSAIVPNGRAEGEVDGPNVHLTSGDLELYRIDGQEWIGQGGQFQSGPAAEQFPPFGEASAAVIDAALASGDVIEVGTEDVNGVTTTHYVIAIDDDARAALAEVPSSAQVWFVANTSEEIVEEGSDRKPRRFGFLEDAEEIEVWVADDLIHRISVDSETSRFTYTFYDFDADITLTPPE